MEQHADRFARQRDLVPLDRLQNTKITVIGVGAIGRQVALQLAAMGAKQLQLMDFDRVDETNIATQGYFATDVGELKVLATDKAVRMIDSSIQVESIADRFRPRYQVGEVVFSCVDSISARSAIWRAVRDRIQLWLDARMLGEVIRILTVGCHHGQDHYAASLFPAQEAQLGRCTSRSTIYAGSVAAGLLTHQFTRWLRGLPLDADTSLNLLSGEMSVA
jgi:sulfur carrier protein ThiS adenylyltransferase